MARESKENEEVKKCKYCEAFILRRRVACGECESLFEKVKRMLPDLEKE